jgi:hypothetical protein
MKDATGTEDMAEAETMMVVGAETMITGVETATTGIRNEGQEGE